MSNTELLNDAFVQTWLKGLSARTKQNYIERIPLWNAFIRMTPTEQIEKRLKDLRSESLTDRIYFETKFREFKEELEQKGTLKARTVTTVLTAVSSFFTRNGLALQLKKGDWKSTLETEVTQYVRVTKQDVKDLYAHGNLRDRILLLSLAQVGLSEADVSALKIQDFPELYTVPDGTHLFFEKPREKSGQTQATCLSYELIHDLKLLLAERGNPKEGFIFVSQTKGQGERLETRRINEIIKALAEKTFDAEKAKLFQTKALRSFYNSALLRAELKSETKDLMMGHGRVGARSHYDYDPEMIKEAYSRAFEHLSINGLQVRQDVAKIREDMQKLVGQQTIEIERQKAENQATKQELREVKEFMSTQGSKLEQLSKALNEILPFFEAEAIKRYKESQQKKQQ